MGCSLVASYRGNHPVKPIRLQPCSSRTADKFVVRLPDGMREKISEVARIHHRSMNSEIICRLEDSLAQDLDLEETEVALEPAALSQNERELLMKFRGLGGSQQKALIEVLQISVSTKPAA